MIPSISFLLRFCIWCLCLGTLKVSFCVEDTNVRCLESERQALIIFKRGLKDSDNKLSSWVGDDCCGWEGIHCNNKTGHVVKLILRNQIGRQISSLTDDQLESMPDVDYQSLFERSCLSGEIKSSLLELKYLKHLDLSINCFGGISIPKFIGSFNNLRYLNLSMAGFGGRVPHELGNLSTLRYLDLNNHILWLPVYTSDGYYVNYAHLRSHDLHVDRLHWLSRLSSLKHLDMESMDLSKAADWLLSVNMLPSIKNLQLSSCNLPNISTPLSLVNLTSLSTLDLSGNSLGPKIPTWLCNISTIVSLGLGFNSFTFPIPASFGSLCNLKTLDLGGNNFKGDINRFNVSFKGCIRGSLEDLYLASNQLSGYLPDWLGQFTNLKSLSLSKNSLSGSIPPSLGTLSSLRELDLSSNSLFGSIPPSLRALSSLRGLYLYDNQLNGSIPKSLGQLTNLEALSLSNNSFESVLSEAHFSNLLKLNQLDLSNNNLHGKIPTEIARLFELQSLNLSKNHLTGIIPQNINDLRWIKSLDLSWNQLSGGIPYSLSYLTSLSWLNLSYNNFSGRIPSGHELDTINDLSIYIGNPFLCGPPISSRCPRDETAQESQPKVDDKEEDKDELVAQLIFYIGMGPGFFMGFWVVCGILLFKRSWRIAYYRFFDDIGDRVYVAIAIKVARFKKNEALLKYRGLEMSRKNASPRAFRAHHSGLQLWS